MHLPRIIVRRTQGGIAVDIDGPDCGVTVRFGPRKCESLPPSAVIDTVGEAVPASVVSLAEYRRSA